MTHVPPADASGHSPHDACVLLPDTTTCSDKPKTEKKKEIQPGPKATYLGGAPIYMYLGLGESGKRRSGGEPARREIGRLWVGPDLLLHPGEVVGRHAAHLLLRQAHHLRIHHRGGGRGSRSGGGGGGGGGRELADSGWDLVGELAPPSLAGWFLVPSLPARLRLFFFILLLFSSSSLLPARWLRVVCFAFEGGRAVVDCGLV